MNSDARLLPLNEIRAGKIGSNDVSNLGLFLEQGAVVTEAILLSLQCSGMEKAINIEREVERERQRQRLAKLFRRCGDGPVGKLLWQYVTQYRLGDWHA
ncbi:MAG: hypothetical protein HHJ09_14735 [Glaciimonas sp.]|nr:hypothetical protein [Glaciimonas sp.]